MLEPEHEDGIRVRFLRKTSLESLWLGSSGITVKSDRAPTMITADIVTER